MLHLFEAVGIELEYMIVDAATLDVRPIADRLLEAQVGRITGDTTFDDGMAWSNELVSHVIELKTDRPWSDLGTLAPIMHGHVRRVNELLRPMNARLLPTAMHPWMDPHRQTVLWQHEYSEVYEAFNRIFDCRGHGWSNLQSMHINLPFASDEEFARLHAAIRLVLPILPALAASSPIMDGRLTGTLDNRLAVYQTNSVKVPSVAGRVIPEPVFSEEAYRTRIFERIWNDLAPHDPQGVLRDEFANARGAIARFGRGSIEIRVIDLQECPTADLAVAALTVAVLRGLVEERWSSVAAQQSFDVEPLAAIFQGCVRDGDAFTLANIDYLQALGLGDAVRTAGDVWRALASSVDQAELRPHQRGLNTLLTHGPLARRITAAVPTPSPDALRDVYGRLADCLATDQLFVP